MRKPPARSLPHAARVLVVLPGGVANDFRDCDVNIRTDDQLVHLYRDGIRIVTAPLDVCIIFWTDEAAEGIPARTVPRPRSEAGHEREG